LRCQARPRPLVERPPGGADGALDLGDAGRLDGGDRLLGGGRLHHQLTALAVHPLPVDEWPARGHQIGHWPLPYSLSARIIAV
jgi:hypothetical protein